MIEIPLWLFWLLVVDLALLVSLSLICLLALHTGSF